jgi:hypothetical protein
MDGANPIPKQKACTKQDATAEMHGNEADGSSVRECLEK